MSYNVDSVHYLSGKLSIRRQDLNRLLLEMKGELPEGNFLEELPAGGDPGELLVIEEPWWHSEGSGYAYEDVLDKVLAETEGEADLMFVWEGGDSFTGLRVKNGVVEEMQVKHELVP